MEYEIIQIDRDTWRIEDSGVRCFLLAGREQGLLIDSGRTLVNARDIAAELTDLPLSLINTHADADHVAGNGKFPSFRMHPAEESNYRRGGRPGEIIPVQEGDLLDLGGRTLEIIHLPGHTPGSIALLDRERRVLISGDPIQDGRIFMFGPFRDMRAYVGSLEHLRLWSGRFDEIWPSHASIPVAPALIEKLHDGALAVLNGEVAGRPEEVFGKRILAYDIGCAVFLCDEKQTGGNCEA